MVQVRERQHALGSNRRLKEQLKEAKAQHSERSARARARAARFRRGSATVSSGS